MRRSENVFIKFDSDSNRWNRFANKWSEHVEFENILLSRSMCAHRLFLHQRSAPIISAHVSAPILELIHNHCISRALSRYPQSASHPTPWRLDFFPEQNMINHRAPPSDFTEKSIAIRWDIETIWTIRFGLVRWCSFWRSRYRGSLFGFIR